VEVFRDAISKVRREE